MMSTKRFVGWLWLLSSLPIGFALWVLPAEGQTTLWAAAIMLDNAHSLSPIAASWAHRGFRRAMLKRPWKTIGLPLLIVSVVTGVGLITSLGWTSFVYARGQEWLITDWTNPFPVVVSVYTIWNFYHFGMQNFGVLSLLRGRRSQWQKTCDMSWTVGATVIAMLVTPGMVEFNHWITELGLCGRISRYAFFLIGAMLAFGAIGFLWMVPTSRGMMMHVVPVVVCARMALGFWHFLQDRWMWKFSDPQVRATIGQDLLK